MTHSHPLALANFFSPHLLYQFAMKFPIGLVFYLAVELHAGFDDSKCEIRYGACKYTTQSCSGRYLKGYCSGPANRQCCVPKSLEDQRCVDLKGVCQDTSEEECLGWYKKLLCSGPVTRVCCIPTEVSDKRCLEYGGICIDSVTIRCEGSFLIGMCAGPKTRLCCRPRQDNRIESDEACLDLKGVCQDSTVEKCQGSYKDEVCSGPPTRQCCVPNDSKLVVKRLGCPDNNLTNLEQNKQSLTERFQKCAREAFTLRYNVFALTDSGECLLGPDAKRVFGNNGTYSDCGYYGELDPSILQIKCPVGYMPGKCPGKVTRKCCVLRRSPDQSCLNFKGRCQDTRKYRCPGSYKKFLCTGRPTRQCCTPSKTKSSVSPLGCWANNASSSLIPSLEQETQFLKENYKTRANPLRKCAYSASMLGYTAFALMDGGKCLSGPLAHWVFRSNGPSSDCSKDGKGGATGMSVYSFPTAPDQRCLDIKGVCLDTEKYKCLGSYKKGLCSGPSTRLCCTRSKTKLAVTPLGCWANNLTDSLIPSLEDQSQFLTDNYKVRTAAPSKCAYSASKLGYAAFALMDGGKCLSGPEAHRVYRKKGPSFDCGYYGKGGATGMSVYSFPTDDDTGWGMWSQWGECTRECGGGTQFRFRGCNSSVLVEDSANCLGSSIERRSCNTKECEPSDDLCQKERGTCQNLKDSCVGHYVDGKCANPTDRKCCVPGDDPGQRCDQVKGVCQHVRVKCKGSYLTGYCRDSPGMLCCSSISGINGDK